MAITGLSSDLVSSDFVELPCFVCSWQRDCPPCDPNLTIIAPADSSDVTSEDCHVLDEGTSSDVQGFHTALGETTGLHLYRVLQFPWRKGYFQGLLTTEKHSLIQLFFSSVGKLRGVHGAPAKHNDRDGINDPVLWSVERPEGQNRFCISSDEEVSEDTDRSTVVVSWFALHAEYGSERPSSDVPSSWDDGCASEEPESSDQHSSDEGACGCYVPVWAQADTLRCQNSTDDAFDNESSDELFGSELAAEFDSNGNLMRAYWGGLQHYRGDTCEWDKSPIPKSSRNCIKWDRDNPKPDESGTILPVMTMPWPDHPVFEERSRIDVWGMHFDSCGKLIKICHIRTMYGCEWDLQVSSEQGYCPCYEKVCLKANYTQQSASPPPPCPTTLSFGCPSPGQRIQENLCLGYPSEDNLVCLYEFFQQQSFPPLECGGPDDHLAGLSSDFTSGPTPRWCIYLATTTGCV